MTWSHMGWQALVWGGWGTRHFEPRINKLTIYEQEEIENAKIELLFTKTDKEGPQKKPNNTAPACDYAVKVNCLHGKLESPSGNQLVSRILCEM